MEHGDFLNDALSIPFPLDTNENSSVKDPCEFWMGHVMA